MKRLREEKTKNFITICSAQETLEKNGGGDMGGYFPLPPNKISNIRLFYEITYYGQGPML
jgi:hypothetical protein